ncbi:MAG: hypothetical protein V3W34_03800 [Phycisphaerae bacterium]
MRSKKSTVVWGFLEQQRFLKLPKTFAYLGRYDNRVGTDVQPRHLMLIIALACRKFGEEPIRAHWQDIASGLGVRTDTLRRWAYELRELGLLEITNHKNADGGNGPNEFDITPFVELLERADERWRRSQARKREPEARTT